MPIPALNARGILPPGLHVCSFEEISGRFGSFQGSDKRVRLYEKLVKYANEARSTRLVRAIVVDGSFITGKPTPEDIDIIVVLADDVPARNLAPFEYNVISKRRIKATYPFDVFVATDGRPEYTQYVEFFAQLKEQPDVKKGLLRVEL